MEKIKALSLVCTFLVSLIINYTSCIGGIDKSITMANKDLTTILSKYINQNQSDSDPGLDEIRKHQGNNQYQDGRAFVKFESDRPIKTNFSFSNAFVTKLIKAIVMLKEKILALLEPFQSRFCQIYFLPMKIIQLATYNHIVQDQ